ncbi:4Fe-4S binding protein [Neobacillus sp.]|uniref:4Fe-4S binding protein n=1 Tax=Neobacillus sp. TaxID=2675273 RepID=UPI0028A0617D|nr:4Fe-4S binding protein [Neobacillus sp.]
MLKTKNAYVTIDENLCKGCGLCVSVCPQETLSLTNEPNSKGYFPALQQHPDGCTACNKCAVMCPEIAIKVFID